MEDEEKAYLQCRGHPEEDDVAHRRAPEQVTDLSKIKAIPNWSTNPGPASVSNRGNIR
jgi:hypothetical protein